MVGSNGDESAGAVLVEQSVTIPVDDVHLAKRVVYRYVTSNGCLDDESEILSALGLDV